MDAALYVRVSSDRQDVDLSVSAQLKALRRYANEHEYRVVKEYVDEAETGRTSDRSGFREMIFGARQDPKPFDVILVWKYARFARNRQDSIVHKAMLRKKGIQVISVTEPIDDTPTGRLLEGIIESLDEFYSDNLGEEVTRGMRESASRGYYLSSRAPYGYKKVRVRDGDRERTRLEINEYQSRVVVSIFDMVQEGKGLCEITKELNSKGIAGPTGKGWGKTTLHTILTNEVYEGTLIWGRNSKRGLQPIIAENACPAIVDKEIFNTVQQRLKDRAPARIHPRRVASRYLLSGIAHCGHSGKALIGQEAKSGQFSYYVCGTLNKKGSGSCRAKYLNANEFERLIVNRIKQHILTPEHLIQLTELVNEEMDAATQSYRQEVYGIESEIANINPRLERLYDAIETGDVNLGDIGPRIRDLRERQEKLMARKVEVETLLSDRRVELASPEVVAEYVEELHGLLNESSLAERRAFIKSFVKDVSVKNSEVLLSYTIPLSTQRISQEKIGVLSTVQDGGPGWIRTNDQSVI